MVTLKLLLCLVRLHAFSPWQDHRVLFAFRDWEKRVCSRCGRTEYRATRWEQR